jgi:peptidyl-prolyl cis-trans isomerase D
MMQKMREMIPLIMWIVIIAFLATIFFAWGMDVSDKKDQPWVAKIGKQKIMLQEFDRMVNIQREQEREKQNGGDLQPYQQRMISRQVLDQEIQRILLRKAFEEMQFSASADEIYEDIKNNPPPEITRHPVFQTDSVFDTTKYIAFLNNPQEVQQLMGLEQHARDFRLPMIKMQSLLEGEITPTKSEIAREYRERNERVIFDYAKVNAAGFKIDSSEITDAMISKYYSANRDTFMHDAQAELYFITVPKKPTAADEEALRAELLEIKLRLEKGDANFEEEAAQVSDDEGTAQQGGRLGTFKKGSMVPEFEAVAFSLPVGAISDPVRTAFGYHLINVENRVENKGVVEVTARHILRKLAASTETIDILEKTIDDLRLAMEEKGFVAAASADTALHLDSTGLFTSSDYIKGLGYLYGAATFAFREEIGAISEKLQDDKAYYVVSLKRRSEKGLLPLADARQEIVKKLIAEAQLQKAKAYLESAIAKAGSSAALAALNSSDAQIVSATSDTVTRKSFVPGLGQASPAVYAALALPQGTVSKVIKVNDGYVVVRPIWQQKSDQIPWESPEIKTVESELLAAERQRVYGDWYLALKRKAKVEEKLNEYYLN